MKKSAQLYSQLLFIAIEQNELTQVESLLQEKTDLSYQKNSQTPIQFAVSEENWDCVSLFCTRRPDEADKARYGYALYMAVKKQKTQLALDLIAAGANVNYTSANYYYYSTLHRAILNHDLKVAEALLQHGARPNYQAQGQCTSLGIAYDNDDLEATKLLLRYGAEATEKLMLTAANEGKWQFVEAYKQIQPVDPIMNLLEKLSSENLKKLEDEARSLGYIDSISHEFMLDPVCTVKGQIYERTKITEWLKNHDTCPLTGITLTSKELTPQPEFKREIKEFLQAAYDKQIEEQKQAQKIREQEIARIRAQEASKIEELRPSLYQEALQTIALQEQAKAEKNRGLIAKELRTTIKREEQQKLELQRPTIAKQLQERLEKQEQTRLIQERRFEQFKLAYYQQYSNTLFKNPWSTMKQKLERGEISSIEEVEEYVVKQPNSRTAHLL